MSDGDAITFVVASAVLFAPVYFLAVTKLSRGLVSPYPKADVRRRLFAATVDILVLLTSLLLYQSSQSVLFVLAGGVYLLLKDAVRGQSLGKLFFGLVVI